MAKQYNFNWIEEEVSNMKLPITKEICDQKIDLGISLEYIDNSFVEIDMNNEVVEDTDEYFIQRRHFINTMIDKYNNIYKMSHAV